MIGESV